MPGNQKEAARIRTAKLLAKDPDHFKKIAAKKKGKPNSSSTKFKVNDKRTKDLARIGAKNRHDKRKRDNLDYEDIHGGKA